MPQAVVLKVESRKKSKAAATEQTRSQRNRKLFFSLFYQWLDIHVYQNKLFSKRKTI